MAERRFAIRAADAGGNVLEGVVVRYGDIAELPWGRERFEAGAFGDVAAADAILNRQHARGRPLARTGGGGLVFEDTPEALSFRAVLADTTDSRDVMALVRAGVLRGASVEFHSRTERYEGDLAVVERAKLVGLAIVDSPAYPESVIAERAAAAAARARGAGNGFPGWARWYGGRR